MGNDTDILGNPITDSERALLDAYATLNKLLEDESQPPAVTANVREAIASLWQAVNDLGLTDERPGT